MSKKETDYTIIKWYKEEATVQAESPEEALSIMNEIFVYEEGDTKLPVCELPVHHIEILCRDAELSVLEICDRLFVRKEEEKL